MSENTSSYPINFDVRKRRFLDALEKCGDERRAARIIAAPYAEIKHWFDDSSFAVEVHSMKENFMENEQRTLDAVEDRVYLAATEAEGDARLSLEVLRARRPERWNPAVKLEVNTLRHKFIDFSGEQIHTKEVDDRTGSEDPGGD